MEMVEPGKTPILGQPEDRGARQLETVGKEVLVMSFMAGKNLVNAASRNKN